MIRFVNVVLVALVCSLVSIGSVHADAPDSEPNSSLVKIEEPSDILISDSRIVAGVGYYRDHRFRHSDESLESMSFFVEFVVTELGPFSFALGGVFPVENYNRSRPSFSVSTTWGSIMNKESWLDPGVGVFLAASPYSAWGVNITIFRIDF